MDQNKDKLVEQDAPLKNTDRAFVKVNKDDSPSRPQTAENKDERRAQEEADLEQQRKETLTERD